MTRGIPGMMHGIKEIMTKTRGGQNPRQSRVTATPTCRRSRTTDASSFWTSRPSRLSLLHTIGAKHQPIDRACGHATKAMGSRYAVNRLMKACKNSPECRSIAFSFEPWHTTFSFANSETSVVRERLHISVATYRRLAGLRLRLMS